MLVYGFVVIRLRTVLELDAVIRHDSMDESPFALSCKLACVLTKAKRILPIPDKVEARLTSFLV